MCIQDVEEKFISLGCVRMCGVELARWLVVGGHTHAAYVCIMMKTHLVMPVTVVCMNPHPTITIQTWLQFCKYIHLVVHTNLGVSHSIPI